MTTMLIYLDTSVYNRPFDGQKQPRIWLETLAFSLILNLIESKQVKLVKSQVNEYENRKNPKPLRKRWVKEYLKLADYAQKLNPQIQKRARILEDEGLEAIDALHLASAEVAEVEYFITCDDEIITQYEGKMNVLNPVEFIRRESETNEQG